MAHNCITIASFGVHGSWLKVNVQWCKVLVFSKKCDFEG